MTSFFKTVFLSGVLLLMWVQARATSIGTQSDHCPHCHHDYMVKVLLSYNNFSGNGGPPAMPPSSCPFCLAVWTGDPPKKLTKPQRQALDAALGSWPDDLSVSERRSLLQELDQRYLEDVLERINEALQARCAAALKGKVLPKFGVKPTGVKKVSRDWDQKDHETFLKELPRLIRAQKEEREAVIRPESEMSSRDIVTLQQARREIANGNALAFEYFVRWTVAVEDDALMDGGRTVGDTFGNLLFVVARCPKLPWPKGVDIGKARSPFAAACLRYAYEPERQLDAPIRKEIANFQPYARVQITLMAAAGKRDRVVAPLLSSLKPSRMDMYGDAFVLFYQSAGAAEDLPFLEACATDAMNRFKSSKKQGMDEGWRYEDPLRAYEITRIKCQLMGAVAPIARPKR